METTIEIEKKPRKRITKQKQPFAEQTAKTVICVYCKSEIPVTWKILALANCYEHAEGLMLQCQTCLWWQGLADPEFTPEQKAALKDLVARNIRELCLKTTHKAQANENVTLHAEAERALAFKRLNI